MLRLTLDRIEEMTTLHLIVSGRLDFRRRLTMAGPPFKANLALRTV
jgi:hypothetical protein